MKDYIDLLNRRQPIPTEEASSQLPLQPALASQPARRKAERRARERERQEPTFIAGELRVILSWRNVSLRTVASDKATLLCNLRILPFYSTINSNTKYNWDHVELHVTGDISIFMIIKVRIYCLAMDFINL